MQKAYCTIGWIQPRFQGSLLPVPTERERGGRIWERSWAVWLDRDLSGALRYPPFEQLALVLYRE